MKSEGLSIEDGKLMRALVDFPGGLELHIGVGRRAGRGACCVWAGVAVRGLRAGTMGAHSAPGPVLAFNT